MANFLELVKMTCASAPGTGTTISLAGAATTGGVTFLTLAQAGAIGGQQYDYSLLDPTNGGCETGTITMPSSGLVMTGRTVYKSSNGNAPINASADAIFSISGLTTTFNDASVIKTGTIDANRLPSASTSLTGAVQLATASDENAGTSTTLAVTPSVQQAHPSAAKAWVDFNGTGTIAIRKSFNVSSITDNGTGDYIVNFAAAMADANYTVHGTGGGTASTSAPGYVRCPSNAGVLNASSAPVQTVTSSGAAFADLSYISLAFFD